VFDADAFALRCQAAATAADPIDAVQAVVAEAVRDGASIDARLGTEIRRDGDVLFASEHLTVLRILWPAGIWAQPHDHRMWAVIGVYSGEEFNRFFKRAADGLTEVDARMVGAGEVLALGAEVIHAVDNSHRALTGGLHVYGGDLSKVQRSAWGPDGLEAPFAKNAAAQAALFQAVRDVAHEYGITLDDAARYRLFRMLEAACVRERRYPTAVETRRMIDEAMNPVSRVPPATG
jgi:predicted metal-dependent enzyme (double-stranded beta helix superfamily)